MVKILHPIDKDSRKSKRKAVKVDDETVAARAENAAADREV